MTRTARSLARYVAVLAVALIAVWATDADARRHTRRSGSHWAGHGNKRSWGKGKLTAGQARASIAAAVAKRYGKLGGLRLRPADVNVTFKVAADGKTAMWRATPKARTGSALRKLASFGRTNFELKGTIDVSIRNPSNDQIRNRAFTLYKQRSQGSAKTDWTKAKKQLTRFGSKPQRNTIQKLAYSLYKSRRAGSATKDWRRATKELKLDLYSGSRVTFINSSKAFNQTSRRLFGTK
jgi:acyl-CoA-binding protein